MNKKLLLLSFIFISFNNYAVDFKEKINCVGNVCNKEVEITNYKQRPLRENEYEEQKCLVEMKPNQEASFFYVVQKEPSKITLLEEVSYEKNVAIYSKVFLWKRELDSRFFKKIPCEQTGAFFDNTQLQSCIKSKKYASKVYCDLKNNETGY